MSGARSVNQAGEPSTAGPLSGTSLARAVTASPTATTAAAAKYQNLIFPPRTSSPDRGGDRPDASRIIPPQSAPERRRLKFQMQEGRSVKRHEMSRRGLSEIEQGRVAAPGRDIYTYGTFDSVACERIRPPRLGSGAGQTFAAKRLHTHNCAYDGTVHVDIASRHQCAHAINEGIEPGM